MTSSTDYGGTAMMSTSISESPSSRSPPSALPSYMARTPGATTPSAQRSIFANPCASRRHAHYENMSYKKGFQLVYPPFQLPQEHSAHWAPLSGRRVMPDCLAPCRSLDAARRHKGIPGHGGDRQQLFLNAARPSPPGRWPKHHASVCLQPLHETQKVVKPPVYRRGHVSVPLRRCLHDSHAPGQ
jgi:hypothetical protein